MAIEQPTTSKIITPKPRGMKSQPRCREISLHFSASHPAHPIISLFSSSCHWERQSRSVVQTPEAHADMTTPVKIKQVMHSILGSKNQVVERGLHAAGSQTSRNVSPKLVFTKVPITTGTPES
ncbi:hypothetical protein HZ326_25981 [Fusarium oxysporum f. sp. albedinis]|nr:hypothetical protein HZ326_25981 [Fusarium oxysporum f. sp. albedinis]